MADDVIASAGQRILLERRLSLLESQLRLYREALKVIKDHWRTDKISVLRTRLESQIPEVMLFPLWNEIFVAKTDATRAAEFALLLDHTIANLDSCLAGREVALAPEIMGEWASKCGDVRAIKGKLRSSGADVR